MSIHQEIIDAFETYIAESQLASTGCDIKKEKIKVKKRIRGTMFLIMVDEKII